MFALFGFHLPISLLLGDVCVYLDDIEQDMSIAIPDPTQAEIVSSCLTNASLADVLNLTEQVSFRDQITFGDIPDISEAFDFTELDTFASEVDSLTVETFGFNSSEIDAMLDRFSNDPLFAPTPGVPIWTREDIATAPLTPAGVLGPVARENYRDGIVTLVETERTLNRTVNDMKRNVTRVTDYVERLEANVTRVNDEVNQIEPIIMPLFDFVDRFLDLATCGFLGVRYYQLKAAMCDTIASSFIMLSLCFFMVGIMGLPIMVMSIILWKRIGKPRTSTEVLEMGGTGPQGTAPMPMQTVQLQPMYVQQQPVQYG